MCMSAQPCPTLPSTIVQQQVVILEFLQEKMSARPSAPPSSAFLSLQEDKHDYFTWIFIMIESLRNI